MIMSATVGNEDPISCFIRGVSLCPYGFGFLAGALEVNIVSTNKTSKHHLHADPLARKSPCIIDTVSTITNGHGSPSADYRCSAAATHGHGLRISGCSGEADLVLTSGPTPLATLKPIPTPTPATPVATPLP
jgi:hypothetical protein